MLELRVKEQTTSRVAKGFPWNTVDVNGLYFIQLLRVKNVLIQIFWMSKSVFWVYFIKGEQGREFQPFFRFSNSYMTYLSNHIFFPTAISPKQVLSFI